MTSDFVKEINEFNADKKALNNSPTLKEFGEKIQWDLENIGFTNDFYVDGFYDFETDITQLFFDYYKIEWGGFFSFKVDFMHFGISAAYYKDLFKP